MRDYFSSLVINRVTCALSCTQFFNHGSQVTHQPQIRNLRRRAKPLRGSPIAGAAADVDPEPVQSMEPGRERMEKAHDEIPREELSAVRMAGELQVEPGPRRRKRGSWLVREQHPDPGVARRTHQSRDRIAALRGIEIACSVVGDSGDYHRRAAMLKHDVLVHEDGDSEAAHFLHPGADAGVVLMIARDEEGAVPGCEP